MKPHVLIGQDGIAYLFIVRLRYVARLYGLFPYAIILTKTTMS